MNKNTLCKMDILIAYGELQSSESQLLISSEALKNQGRLKEAAAAYEQLISVLHQLLELEKINNTQYPESPYDHLPTVNIMLNSMLTWADILETLGDSAQAEKIREEVRQLSGKYLSQVDQAERERQLATSLVPQGRFNEALTAFTVARDLFQESNDALNTASVTANMADILEWLEDYERALVEVERAKKLLGPLTGGKKPSQTGMIASLLGGRLKEAERDANLLRISLDLDQTEARINRRLGNFAESELQFREILPQVPQGGQVGIEFQLAAILVDSGRYAEGLEYLKRLEPSFKGIARPKLGVLLSYEAEALLGLGEADEALKKLNTAIRELSQYRDLDSLWKTQWRRARALTTLHQPKEALTTYAQAADTINALRKAPLGYRLDSTYLKAKLPVFEAAIELACERGEAEICCRFIEMIKSRTLTAALSIPDSAQPKNATDLDQRVDGLSRQIDALEYEAYRNGPSDELEQKRTELISERIGLLEKIRFSDPRWRSLSEPIPFDLQKTLDTLAKREQAALTLFFQPVQVIGVLLKDNECSVAKMQISSETSEALAKYQLNLQVEEANRSWFDPSIGLGLKAEHLAPAELLEKALEARSLVIVPHGPLHLVPWAGLMFKGKRLFEYCPVGIIPNLSCLLGLQADFSPAPRVGLIGAPDYSSLPRLQPLDMARQELQNVEEIYSSGAGIIGKPLMGGNATEATFWELTKHPDSVGGVLHVVCHGKFETGDPMNSGLLLTDGKADASEIARSRLRYDEVVLSACSTGRRPTAVQGVALTGDDILGLPGALLEAGARSILVSIPPAREDATLSFMTVYHENRAKGRTPLHALQEAQMAMLSDSLLEPYLWIGLTAYGSQ